MTVVSFKQPHPAWLIRGQDNITSLESFSDGVAVPPDSGTYMLTDETGAELVSAGVISAGTTSTYTVPAATVPTTRNLSWYWVERWAVVIDGVTHTFRRPAWHVYGRIYPGIVVDDLIDLEDCLVRLLETGRDPEFKRKIQAAWEYLIRKLIAMGQRPPRILNGDCIVDAHRFVALWMIFNGAGPTYQEKAGTYYELARDALKDLRATLDFNDDGRPDSTEEGQGVVPAYVFSAGPVNRYWRGE